MSKTKIYKDIPVILTTETEQLFDFELGESGQVGQYAKISSEGHELIIGVDLSYLDGDMPEKWRQPAVQKLLALVRDDNKTIGDLN
ncbi:hypothetical protein D3C81_996330 [compost metagenome]|uniref:Uncharacterized protein n=1 Tax=Sphingobacterium paramultivorum TaxID=2886510 RepID=A0A7G5E1W0_9SPHI|nr:MULTISPECIES: hypothetical protein [Sphingobacterium]MCS4167921.1 hypothetical protein [Sphingobacterium sp. BIGb0116]QMV67985.1 hypothetical protein HS960_10075 [Sphingobacterium paramultivorum]WSO16885.1 hypothetical protein VUL84_10060 [Sphingobacterium paramultivorum]